MYRNNFLSFPDINNFEIKPINWNKLLFKDIIIPSWIMYNVFFSFFFRQPKDANPKCKCGMKSSFPTTEQVEKLHSPITGINGNGCVYGTFRGNKIPLFALLFLTFQYPVAPAAPLMQINVDWSNRLRQLSFCKYGSSSSRESGMSRSKEECLFANATCALPTAFLNMYA